MAGSAPWEEFAALAAQTAPQGFMVFWKNDARPVMTVAGNRGKTVAYLMGNHIIAQRMHAYDPRVLNYAPLRVEFTLHHGLVQFTCDQPSTQFASFGVPEITAVGLELDPKLAGLVEALGAEVPQEMRGEAVRGDA